MRADMMDEMMIKLVGNLPNSFSNIDLSPFFHSGVNQEKLAVKKSHRKS